MLIKTCTLCLLFILVVSHAQAETTSLNASTRFVKVEDQPVKYERIASKASHYNFRYACQKKAHARVKDCVKVYQ